MVEWIMEAYFRAGGIGSNQELTWRRRRRVGVTIGTLLAKVVSRSCLTTLLPCLLNRRDTYSRRQARRMCTLVVYSTAVSSQLTANLAPSATAV